MVITFVFSSWIIEKTWELMINKGSLNEKKKKHKTKQHITRNGFLNISTQSATWPRPWFYKLLGSNGKPWCGLLGLPKKGIVVLRPNVIGYLSFRP